MHHVLGCLLHNALISWRLLSAVQIVDIVAGALTAMGSKTDYASGFLDLCVYQMQQGCVEPVLTMVSRWGSAGSADPLLIRHFIFKTLAVCGPPYSAHFAATLLR